MKTVYNNDMVAHLWANRSQEYARGSSNSLRFNNRILYSYSTPIGYHAKNVDWTFITRGYFSTSSYRHISLARFATHGRTAIVFGLDILLDTYGGWRSKDKKNNVIEYLVKYHEENDEETNELIAQEFKLNKKDRAKVASGIRRNKRRRDREDLNRNKKTVSEVLRIKRVGLKMALDTSHIYADFDDGNLYYFENKENEIYGRVSADLTRAIRFINKSGLYGQRTKKTVQDLRREFRDFKSDLSLRQSLRRTRAKVRDFCSTIRFVDSVKNDRENANDSNVRMRLSGSFPTSHFEYGENNLVEAEEAMILSKAVALEGIRNSRYCTPAFLANSNAWLEENKDEIYEAKDRRKRRSDSRISQYEIEREMKRINEEARRVTNVKDWLAGKSVHCPRDARDENGGFLVRVIGKELQTSGGAIVPLKDAISAYKIIALCKEKGIDWKRQEKSIPVGKFHIDIIKANGDFIAGCHNFTWDTIHAVAESIGVA